ncbi:TPA: hypothetical protein ACH3X3_000763 [Trebouxia sp. C0006]
MIHAFDHTLQSSKIFSSKSAYLTGSLVNKSVEAGGKQCGTPKLGLLCTVAVPSLQSMPSFLSSFSLWLARRWPALTHVSIIDLCEDTVAPLENILATCTSSISGSILGPEIALRSATDPGQEHWAATRFAELFTADV